MKAVKGNKVYTIDDAQKKGYQDAGYDILSDSGNLLAYGRGKTVPFEEYEAVKKALEEAGAGADAKLEADTAELLRVYAKEHGIDVGKAGTVAGLVKKIQGAAV